MQASAGKAAPPDDVALPFQVTALDARGRVVRLGPSIDTIIQRHGYPEAVSRAVAEAAVLTALLGTSLKFDGRFQFQTKTDGPIDLLVVDFEAPDKLRAYARFDAARVAETGADIAALIGNGYLAMTIEPGGDMNRYQGIVALEGQSLEEAAHQYFRQSEQIPTRVRLAVAEVAEPGGATHWRAGGLLVQFLPTSPERQRQQELDPGDAPEGTTPPAFAEDDAWVEVRALTETIEDHELVDPGLSSEELLYRLFHERGVTVFERQPLREACRCSRERIMAMFSKFSTEDRRAMIGDDGQIGVTCEFCSTRYNFAPAEIEVPAQG
jgi:molecular chaperone Hsp33